MHTIHAIHFLWIKFSGYNVSKKIKNKQNYVKKLPVHGVFVANGILAVLRKQFISQRLIF